MAEPFLGQIQQFGFNFAPRGWAFCSGQLLAIAQNDALFALIGTTYGGDGQTTFGLPDLRGRTGVHQGQAPGLSSYVLGQKAGTETVTLLSTQMPTHNHTVAINPSTGTSLNTTPAANKLGAAQIYTNAALDSVMDPGTVTAGISGGSQPHENRQPFLVVNWCIALEGIFPSQN
jgi:microcystin-dependent protein